MMPVGDRLKRLSQRFDVLNGTYIVMKNRQGQHLALCIIIACAGLGCCCCTRGWSCKIAMVLLLVVVGVTGFTIIAAQWKSQSSG